MNNFLNSNYIMIKSIKLEFIDICIENIDIITNNTSHEIKNINKCINDFINNHNCYEITFNILKINLINGINNLINIYTTIAQENQLSTYLSSNMVLQYFSLINKLSMLNVKISHINPNYFNNINNHQNLQNININNFGNTTNFSNVSLNTNSLYFNTINPPLNPHLSNLNTVPTNLPKFNPFTSPIGPSNPSTNSTIQNTSFNPGIGWSSGIKFNKINVFNNPNLMDDNDDNYDAESFMTMHKINKNDKINMTKQYINSKNTIDKYFKKEDIGLKEIKITKIHKKSISNNSLESMDESIYNKNKREEIKQKSLRFGKRNKLPLTKIQGKEIKINYIKSYIII